MKNCLNCKYCKVVEKFTWDKDREVINITCFECNANRTKQYFMKPVLNCKEYKKRGFVLNE